VSLEVFEAPVAFDLPLSCRVRPPSPQPHTPMQPLYLRSKPLIIVLLTITAWIIPPATAQESFPTQCSSNTTNATVVVTATASESVVNAVSLTQGDPLIAVTTSEENCAGETALDTNENMLLSVAEADATTSTPGYSPGDTFTFWAQDDSGEIYELTPVFADCGPDAPPLCADDASYQSGMVYEVADFSVSVLPVELVSWSAIVDDGAVILEWATATETNNAGFDVLMTSELTAETESSGRWETIGFVEGRGTTNQPQSYRFVTSSMRSGEYSFRLRQVDVDGTQTLTDPIRITVGQKGALQLSPVAPHPVVGQSSFDLTLKASRDVTVALYNILGQRVSTLHEGTISAGNAHPLTIDASTLSSGRYLLRISGSGIDRTTPVTVLR